VPRVCVYIDQQNFYRSTRDAYGWAGLPSLEGNANPLHLARLLATGPLAIPTHDGEVLSEREITVRVYMGMPSQRHDPKEYARAQRQLQHWERAAAPGCVRVFHRTLRYPPRWQPGVAVGPREKGIDVMLAMDIVRGAIDATSECANDLAILVSADTDLLPAVEFLVERRGAETIQTAAPANRVHRDGRVLGNGPAPIRASAAAGRATNKTILIPEAVFKKVADRVDHYRPRSETAPSMPQGRRPRPPRA
jgi:NYN domain